MTHTVDPAQSVLPLLAAHGLVPATKSLDVQFRRPHPAQAKVRREMKRFNVASCGRRFGKTHMCVDWVLEPSVKDALPVAWFAPTFKMLSEVFNDVAKILGNENIASKNKQQGEIVLKNGGRVDFWSLEAAPTLRGRKYARVVVDEAAHVKCDLQKVWEEVIRPTLTDYKGDAFFISTPNGYNFFRTLFERGEDPKYPEWICWQLPTTANPFIDPKEVEQAREELDEQSFQQEYLAAFLRDEGKVFRNVEANLISPEGQTPEMHAGHNLVAGVDWAQIKDFTVNSIGCATCRQEVFLDRFNQIEFHFQRERLISEWVRWGVRTARVEENSIGKPNYEELVRSAPKLNDGRAINLRLVRLTSESKPKLVQALALSLEKEQFQFLPSVVGRNELLAYEAKVNPNTGRIVYTAPAGAHDDTVVARFIMLSNVHSGGVARVLNFRVR
ncbi:MAG: terminase large subunit domain-containing protein [Pyrinomonadaceae bacterium]